MSKELGLYCKAYHLRDMRAYPQWQEQAAQARPASETDTTPRLLSDDSVVYLQEDLSVTDDIFLGEHVLFSSQDSAWSDFCRGRLGFAVPEDVLEAERKVQQDIQALQSA